MFFARSQYVWLGSANYNNATNFCNSNGGSPNNNNANNSLALLADFKKDGSDNSSGKRRKDTFERRDVSRDREERPKMDTDAPARTLLAWREDALIPVSCVGAKQIRRALYHICPKQGHGMDAGYGHPMYGGRMKAIYDE